MQHKIFSERVKVIFKVIKKLQHNHLITKAANSRPSHGNIYQHFFFPIVVQQFRMLHCFRMGSHSKTWMFSHHGSSCRDSRWKGPNSSSSGVALYVAPFIFPSTLTLTLFGWRRAFPQHNSATTMFLCGDGGFRVMCHALQQTSEAFTETQTLVSSWQFMNSVHEILSIVVRI